VVYLANLGSSMVKVNGQIILVLHCFPFSVLVKVIMIFAEFIGVRFIILSSSLILLCFQGGFELHYGFINSQKFCKQYSSFSLVYNSQSQKLRLKS
jgi:hypothetical protein